MSEIDPRAAFYTYTGSPKENEVVFVGSSAALAPEPWGAKFMQGWTPDTPEDAAIILHGLIETKIYPTIYTDDFGSWISGYTPIRDSQGNVVGALGIDFSAVYVRRVQDDVKDAVVPAFGITAILVIGSVLVVSRLLTRRITALTRAAERIGEGDYEQDLSKLTPGRFSDEIGTLAQVFEIMVGKVAKREEKLKQQVAELQIMIDESKRQEQVEEIVDSDFFRDLQEKARKLRQDFAQAGAPAQPTPATPAPESKD
jgi:methyl-accepting chemotaxis protein